jgi:hypothetical protein
MMGTEFPSPGKATFQVTFSVADHFVDRPVSVETPFPSGPRQAGQLPANVETVDNTIVIAITVLVSLRGSLL